MLTLLRSVSSPRSLRPSCITTGYWGLSGGGGPPPWYYSANRTGAFRRVRPPVPGRSYPLLVAADDLPYTTFRRRGVKHQPTLSAAGVPKLLAINDLLRGRLAALRHPSGCFARTPPSYTHQHILVTGIPRAPLHHLQIARTRGSRAALLCGRRTAASSPLGRAIGRTLELLPGASSAVQEETVPARRRSAHDPFLLPIARCSSIIPWSSSAACFWLWLFWRRRHGLCAR